MTGRSQASPQKLDLLAAFLSYLIPGLGQVIQGRILKGIMYFLCLYSLFFYGLALGELKNVWLPDASELPPVSSPFGGSLSGVPKALYYRPQYLGQFWIGVAAWPAIIQYRYTEPPPEPGQRPAPTRLFGHFMQAPSELEMNVLLRNSNKLWDLGWVYTVIAGALNLLVIYDALAGPVIREEEISHPGKNSESAT
jgi:hypothetical protein